MPLLTTFGGGSARGLGRSKGYKPGAPTIGTATANGSSAANVTFTAPLDNGGAAITKYTAISTPGSITGTLSQAGSGTVQISGLTSGTAYTFKVYATNKYGDGAQSSASNSVTPALAAPSTIDVLVVGGGGGGSYHHAGGGAGGVYVRTNQGVVSCLTYSITVGGGGSGAPVNNNGSGTNGDNSCAWVTAAGGGGGGGPCATGISGGSGGGGGRIYGTGGPPNGYGSGNYGGWAGRSGSGGGGGGASSGGYHPSCVCNVSAGGCGGYGISNNYGGSAVYYGCGGGGTPQNNTYGKSGCGGYGNGGRGGKSDSRGGCCCQQIYGPTNGAGSTGGGGGGGVIANPGYSNGICGANGGSGVVIVRYPDTYKAATTSGSPTYTVSGGYRRYKFTGSGTIRW